MTQAFLIVVRILIVGLLLYWGYRLWTGTQSRTSRILGMCFSAILIWQTAVGPWT